MAAAQQGLQGTKLRSSELLAARQQSCFWSVQRTQLCRRAPRELQRAAALVLSVNQPYGPDPSQPFQPPQYTYDPSTDSSGRQPEKEKPLVRVQLSVHYRVHSRQMLCVGGSQIPFGWSFLSIAKVPMTWNQGDIWTCEVRGCSSCAHTALLGGSNTQAAVWFLIAAITACWTTDRVQIRHFGRAGGCTASCSTSSNSSSASSICYTLVVTAYCLELPHMTGLAGWAVT
jgi:hypothetical protein